MTEYFKTDLHLHFPRRDEYKLLEVAIANGINLLNINDYGTTKRFDAISNNINYIGDRFLPSKEWGLEILSPVLLRVHNRSGYVYLVKGEEVKTKQGHFVAVGIKNSIPNGKDIIAVLNDVHSQGGFGIFAHPLSILYRGCGEKVVKEICIRYSKVPLTLEQNAQIPESLGFNQDALKLANELNIACFGNSDIHGRYLKEYKKVGTKLHSVIPKELIDESRIVESLENVILNSPEKIVVEGELNSLLETFSWMAHSFIRNRGLTMLDAFGITKYSGERK
nr:hypothetical protein [Nanoarchaeum sp.]